MYEKLNENKLNNIDENSKLYLYKQLKHDDNTASYLLNCKIFNHRKSITKLRI